MDFISNLIKRPISLVLNESTEELRQQASPECESITPPRAKNAILTTMNNSGTAPLASPTRSNSATTIEELLIQINDNLNQANFCEVASTAEQSSTVSKGNFCKVDSTSLMSAASTEPDGDEAVGYHLNRSFKGQDPFDLPNLPELPKELTNDIFTDVSFEDDLVPIMSVNTNSLQIKGDINKSQLNISTNETDTAFSSDNETFAECQSFPEQMTGLSEADSYLSAVEVRNDTLKNVSLEQTLNLVQFQKTIPENQQDKHYNDEYEDEPMDVDMSFTQDKLSNVSVGSIATLVAEEYRVEPLLSNAVTKNNTIEQDLIRNKTVERFLNFDGNNIASTTKLECEQNKHEILLNRGIEKPSNAVSTNIEVNKNMIASAESCASLLERAKVALSTFPIKSERRDQQHFPRSPKADVEKEMVYLEKSEYAEHIDFNRTPEIDSNVAPVQREDHVSPTTTNAHDVVNATFESVPADSSSPELSISKAAVECADSPNNSKVENRISVTEGNTTMDTSHSATDLDAETTNAARRTFGIVERNAIIDTFYPVIDIDAEGKAPMDTSQSADDIDEKTTNAARRTFRIAKTNVTDGPPNELQNNSEISTESSQSEIQANSSEIISDSSQIEKETPNAQLCISIEPINVDDNIGVPVSPPTPSVQVKSLDGMTSPDKANSIQTSEFLEEPLNKQQNVVAAFSSPKQSSTEVILRMAPLSQSPPIPTLQKYQHKEDESPSLLSPPSKSPPVPALQKCQQIAMDAIIMSSLEQSPLHQSIHLVKEDPLVKPALVEALSAKEKTKSNARDEKDVFIDKFTVSPEEEIFSDALSHTEGFSGFAESRVANERNTFVEQSFPCGNNLILNPSDFAYLLTKGNSNEPVDRSSILLKFDPLLGVPEGASQARDKQKSLQQIFDCNNYPCLSPTLEEDEQTEHNRSASALGESVKLGENCTARLAEEFAALPGTSKQAAKSKKHASMSVDVIKDINVDNDSNKSFENSNLQSDEKQINYKMDELEKKIKNEVLKTEDIEKKLKDAEQREEALIKRITEKDKTVAKMNGVVEAYEKAIAELIAEKEQLIQNYEKQLAEVKADRDSNYHHLTSLETTFSDLHVKYEKSKEMTLQLKSNEESLLAEKRQNREYLRLQEQRYDKMKNHAMQQLEIANRKLETITKEHATETTKLKALLKKEEISRASMTEQLQQKTRENTELMQICDELINAPPS